MNACLGVMGLSVQRSMSVHCAHGCLSVQRSMSVHMGVPLKTSGAGAY